jgi:demethylmenaquinone methyltransferase / 2-methoxy-6-polyprenyl-1,4-benzoquinol methylase
MGSGRAMESSSKPAKLPDREIVTDLFHRLAPRYNRVVLAYTFGQDLRWKGVLVKGLHPTRGERALDLACGTGLILDRLGKKLGPSQAVGADINRTMLLEAKRSGRANPIVQANAEHLPFAAGSFDLVSAGYLLKYIPIDRFLPEVARVLKPGGRFGGYDFSRPRVDTPSGTLYSIYLRQVLPKLGRESGSRSGGWKDVFPFLSEVVDASGWEADIGEKLTLGGFSNIRVDTELG